MAGGSATAGGSAGPGTAPGASNGGPGDHLWKDNWDDDDVEDDFSKALRYVGAPSLLLQTRACRRANALIVTILNRAELDKSSVAQAVSS